MKTGLREIVNQDDESPYIDYIDGVFFQTNSFIELCYSYSYMFYITKTNIKDRKFVDKNEFFHEFTNYILSNKIRDNHIFKDTAKVVFQNMLLKHKR